MGVNDWGSLILGLESSKTEFREHLLFSVKTTICHMTAYIEYNSIILHALVTLAV